MVLNMYNSTQHGILETFGADCIPVVWHVICKGCME